MSAKFSRFNEGTIGFKYMNSNYCSLLSLGKSICNCLRLNQPVY